MNPAQVKKVLLAGLSGKITQWRHDSDDHWQDDKIIVDKITSAEIAIKSNHFEIRVKPKKLGGEPNANS